LRKENFSFSKKRKAGPRGSKKEELEQGVAPCSLMAGKRLLTRKLGGLTTIVAGGKIKELGKKGEARIA